MIRFSDITNEELKNFKPNMRDFSEFSRFINDLRKTCPNIAYIAAYFTSMAATDQNFGIAGFYFILRHINDCLEMKELEKLGVKVEG